MKYIYTFTVVQTLVIQTNFVLNGGKDMFVTGDTDPKQRTNRFHGSYLQQKYKIYDST